MLSILPLLPLCLVAASPVVQQGRAPQPRSVNAAVIPLENPVYHKFDARSGKTKTFDVAAAKKEQAAVKKKHGVHRQNQGTKREVAQRSPVRLSEPFDIKDLRVSSHFEKRQNLSGSESLTNARGLDYAYYGTVSLGTPAQNTTVLFDTGSSDLIIPLSSCTTCNIGPLFRSNRSSTFHDTTYYFDIQYLDGSASRGTVAYDVVSVAGLSVTNQSFGAILMESNGDGLPSAGIMGMGFPPNAQTRDTPFVFNLASNHSLESNVFSFYLSREKIKGSELCLGCVDSTKFNGTLAWYPLDTNSTNGTSYWWNIASDGLSVNSTAPTTHFDAIIDTGASLVYVPPRVAEHLYASIPSAEEAVLEIGPGFYTFPCADVEKLPSIAFVFNGTAYEVDRRDFNLGSADMFSDRCVGGIVGMDVGLRAPAAILGAEFLKGWYSTFDIDGGRVGFAPAIDV